MNKLSENTLTHIINILEEHCRACESQARNAANSEHKSNLMREFADTHRAIKELIMCTRNDKSTLSLYRQILYRLNQINNLDQSSLDYLAGQYSKLKDKTKITLYVSDYEGNKTR